MRAFDPNANEARQERYLWRGLYNIDQAMILWHVDSYEKLAMYCSGSNHRCVQSAH